MICLSVYDGTYGTVHIPKCQKKKRVVNRFRTISLRWVAEDDFNRELERTFVLGTTGVNYDVAIKLKRSTRDEQTPQILRCEKRLTSLAVVCLLLNEFIASCKYLTKAILDIFGLGYELGKGSIDFFFKLSSKSRLWWILKLWKIVRVPMKNF